MKSGCLCSQNAMAEASKNVHTKMSMSRMQSFILFIFSYSLYFETFILCNAVILLSKPKEWLSNKKKKS